MVRSVSAGSERTSIIWEVQDHSSSRGLTCGAQGGRNQKVALPALHGPHGRSPRIAAACSSVTVGAQAHGLQFVLYDPICGSAAKCF